jgi:hypothetical protein
MHGDVIFQWDPNVVANVIPDCMAQNTPHDCGQNDVGRLELIGPDWTRAS